MSDTTLPAPLVPAEVDLNGYGFMPMLHHRVLQSTLFVKSSGDEFKAAFALWCASWSEKPAGSLPNDEEMLEHFSCSKTWKRVRDRALHGWILCSDGRMYHPVIAPLAIDAWARRQDFQEQQENRETRQDRWRRRVKELSEELRQLGITPPRNAGLEKLETLLRDAQTSQRETVRDADVDGAETSQQRRAEMALTGTETGTETRKRKEHAPPSPPAQARVPMPDLEGHQPTPAGLACRAMRKAGLQAVNPGDPRLRTLLEQGVTAEELAGVAAEAVAKGKAFAWVLAVVQSRRQEAAAIALAPPAPVTKPSHDADRTAEYLREQFRPITAEEKARADEARKRAMAAVGRVA